MPNTNPSLPQTRAVFISVCLCVELHSWEEVGAKSTLSTSLVLSTQNIVLTEFKVNL